MGRLTASMMMMLLGRVVEGQGGARVFTGAGRAFERCRTGRCRVPACMLPSDRAGRRTAMKDVTSAGPRSLFSTSLHATKRY